MKKHIKNYLQATKKLPHEICCEICGSYNSIDIHHIEFGRYKRDDSFKNLIALCRLHHDCSHFKQKPYLTKEQLYDYKKYPEDYINESIQELPLF